MNHPGIKITQVRKNKGLSQEKLSEDSKINLRTLQRIEKGDTFPHGETLIRISQALDISLEDLIEFGFTENYGYIKAMHFVTLIFIILPFGNIFLPLLFWLFKKDQVKDLSFFAKKLINFQITWSLITYFPFAIILFNILTGIHIPLPNFIKTNFTYLVSIFPMIMYTINAIYLIITGMLIKDQIINYFQ